MHQLSGDCVYLASFLAVWEVAVSGKASGSKGLPWVRMLWSLKGEGGGAMMSGLVNLTWTAMWRKNLVQVPQVSKQLFHFLLLHLQPSLRYRHSPKYGEPR